MWLKLNDSPVFLSEVAGDRWALTPSCCPHQALVALRWLCSPWRWHFPSVGSTCVLGKLAESSQGQSSALSAWAASGYFCTCWACAAAKTSSVHLCVALRAERGLGSRDSMQGDSRACLLPVPLPRAVLGCPGGAGMCRSVPCHCSLWMLLQLCRERCWSSTTARCVQERGWGWQNLCLVELTHTLQAQPAGFVTPGGNSCGEYTGSRARKIPELEASWAASVPCHTPV